MRMAYSYLRFSNPSQANGDSIRRQDGLRDAWRKRHPGVTLDTSLTFKDEGKSAFSKRWSDREALGEFLRLVKSGRIRKGSYLIVENLDRLTREEIVPALRLFLEILEHGILIVQLEPETVFDPAHLDPFKVMQAVMELSRGNSESKLKSVRVGQAWQAKRDGATGRKLTSICPAWLSPIHHPTLTNRTGKPVVSHYVVNAGSKIVQRMFRLSLDGMGTLQIAKTLNAEGEAITGERQTWTQNYVWSVLRNRAVLGEFQPHIGRRHNSKASGDPVPDYFPRIVSDADFYRVQTTLANRKTQRGPVGRCVANLFTGLLRNSHGDTLVITEKTKGDKRLVGHAARHGGGEYLSFSYAAFERAFLAFCRQVKPVDLSDRPPDDPTASIVGELAKVQDTMGKVKDRILDGDVEALDILRKLEGKAKGLSAKLEKARMANASPASETWGELHHILNVLDDAADPAPLRSRLRSRLAAVIQSITLTITGDRTHRVAECEVEYRSGKRQTLTVRTARMAPVQAECGDWQFTDFTGKSLGWEIREATA